MCVEVLKQSKGRNILGAKMKSFFDWILLAGMAATALFAAVGDWLPVIQTRLAVLRMVTVTGVGGFNWTVAGGVIFLVVVLVLYFKAGKTTTGGADGVGIDYSVPHFIKVRVIE